MTGGSQDDVSSPTMSRRHVVGAASARSLLFTVLGEYVLPGDRAVWTSSAIEVLHHLGIEEKAARQALIRTAADGWLAPERHGRRTRWHLTSQAQVLLRDGTERIYGFTGVMPRWNGSVVLIVVRVPEADRASRHTLRTRLSWAGFGSPVPGIWISTHADRIGEVEALLRETDVADARIFCARHIGGADLKSMVEQAWELDSVETRYRSFLDDFAESRTSKPLARLVELVHAWRRFPSIDPALPRELLPSHWSGEPAAQLFAKRHANWSTRAKTQWEQINTGSS
jgi:phenylacetic acid degradation operon negative regulatory protein